MQHHIIYTLVSLLWWPSHAEIDLYAFETLIYSNNYWKLDNRSSLYVVWYRVNETCDITASSFTNKLCNYCLYIQVPSRRNQYSSINQFLRSNGSRTQETVNLVIVDAESVIYLWGRVWQHQQVPNRFITMEMFSFLSFTCEINHTIVFCFVFHLYGFASLAKIIWTITLEQSPVQIGVT